MGVYVAPGRGAVTHQCPRARTAERGVRSNKAVDLNGTLAELLLFGMIDEDVRRVLACK